MHQGAFDSMLAISAKVIPNRAAAAAAYSATNLDSTLSATTAMLNGTVSLLSELCEAQ